MAPEVLSKGTAYDSSADWFSFGCMLYKLLKGHSPFRQHKTKDKHEIDRMTLTMVSPSSDGRTGGRANGGMKGAPSRSSPLCPVPSLSSSSSSSSSLLYQGKKKKK